MDEIPSRFLNNPKGAILSIRVTPRAKKNQVTQILADGTIKITLTAPPVEGKANAALVKYLAEILQVPVNSIVIVAGALGRKKLVKITGFEADVLSRRIADSLTSRE